MRKLTVSVETFTVMLLGLIQSGVTFEAHQDSNKSEIIIIFTGGF